MVLESDAFREFLDENPNLPEPIKGDEVVFLFAGDITYGDFESVVTDRTETAIVRYNNKCLQVARNQIARAEDYREF